MVMTIETCERSAVAALGGTMSVFYHQYGFQRLYGSAIYLQGGIDKPLIMTMTKSVIPEPPAPERSLPIIAVHKELENPLGKD